jgi:hypothetical protein
MLPALLVGLIAGTMALGAAQDPARREPLPSDLRERVQRLEADVAQAPTRLGTLANRAAVLWEWANALAIEGGVIPDDLPALIAAVRAGAATGRSARSPALAEQLDRYVHELAVKTSAPGAIGEARLSRSDPLIAQGWYTVRQTYTVGELPMVAGGGVAIGRDGFNHVTGWGQPQVDAPAGDNFFSIRASRPEARFVHAGPGDRQTLTTPILHIFRLEGATLEPGDTITMTYGDRSRGSRGFQVQGNSVDQLTFPFYVDLEGEGNFFQPRWPSISVVGMPEVTGVTAFAPSIVTPGEPFEMTVRSEDRLYNRSTGPIPAYELLLDGEPCDRIPAGDEGLVVLADLRITTPGVHRFTLRSEDGRVRGSSNPIWVRERPPYRIYWGETHGHNALDDGQGSAEGYFLFGRDDAALDFLSLSLHDLWADASEWRTLQEVAEAFHEDGRFIPIMASEWTVGPGRGGHHNVYYRDRSSPLVGAQIAPVLKALYEELRRHFAPDDVLTIPHAHSPGDWRQSDPELERLVEITSTHGTFEWFGVRYLENGWRVGFIGSSDNHHEHPGYTETGRTPVHGQIGGLAAVLAQEKTSDAIFDALRARRAYATSSAKRIILDATLDGEPMGGVVAPGRERRLHCRVMGTAPIDTIDVVKNGSVVYRRRYLDQSLRPHCWVRVGFESSSEVFEHTTPRGYRTWTGTLEVRGARIADLDSPSFSNRWVEHARRVPGSRDRIELFDQTRGRADALLLELEDATGDTIIEIDLEEFRLSYAAAVHSPATTISFRLGDADQGRIERVIEAREDGGRSAVDRVTLQLFEPWEGLDQELSFTDLENLADGDWYYVRVTQVDGEQAWSSPWWIDDDR